MSLNEIYPDLVKLWHPTKNGDSIPSNVSAKSDEKYWWFCDTITCNSGCKHEWEDLISKMINYRVKCPFCSSGQRSRICVHESIVHTHPNVFKLWHPTKNIGLNPENFTAGSSKIMIWWKCPNSKCGCEHAWEAPINRLIRSFKNSSENLSCPFCNNNIVCIHTSLKGLYPKIADEWHPTKNAENKPSNFPPGSSFVAWWKCSTGCGFGCEHIWEARIANRVRREDGCPYCRKHGATILCYHQSLEFLFPSIAVEWDYEKNEKPPSKYRPHSAEIVHWKCSTDNNHRWETGIGRRIDCGTNCPFCKNKTESMLYEFLSNLHTTKIQVKYDWCINCETGKYLPFDFVIEELNLIIELDGIHHFEEMKNWKTNPDDVRERDIYKMIMALDNGYSVIRLLQEDVYYNRNNWKHRLSEYIKLFDIPACHFIDNKNEYDAHKHHLNEVLNPTIEEMID